MKALLASLLLSAAAFAQSPSAQPGPAIITFNRADAAHCKVALAGGKPLLETTYDGTTVAIGMPQNRGNGDFSVFVSVYRVAEGTVKVVPKSFAAVYSDPGHTRFPFFDMGAELEMAARARALAEGQSGAGEQLDMGVLNHASHPPSGAATTIGSSGIPSDTQMPAVLSPAIFLHPATLKQGAGVSGFVFFRKPKKAKVEITPTGMLDQIDIPVNGVVFRF
ncbi:MAG: hypothetical protein KGM96_10275 [Acidobacteriota bacterium]|nr:hypothetical protein [Acidobacteriota bacterium]